jgi:hypothetical protein
MDNNNSFEEASSGGAIVPSITTRLEETTDADPFKI